MMPAWKMMATTTMVAHFSLMLLRIYSLLICPSIDVRSAYLTKVLIEISPQVISI